MPSLSILSINPEDIQGHLGCDKKRVYQIMGVAKDGKFADIIMDDFWLALETCNSILNDEDQETQDFYEELGKETIQTLEEIESNENYTTQDPREDES